ncbi:MAG TPA: hypothetical protein V6C98_18070 [Thermosynechococcaceae cyanobacterium]|jgi:seryl-tRNA synthetase
MLLSTLTASLQSDYANLQAQIEAMQEQQRQIVDKLQQVGAVSSKMQTAVLALQEAIASVNEVCPEELGNYKETITSLFQTPVAILEAAVEESETEAPEVELDTIDIEPTEYGVEESPEDETVEVADDGSNGKVYLTADELNELPIGKVRSLAAKFEVSAKGKRYEIAARLKGMVTQADMDTVN